MPIYAPHTQIISLSLTYLKKCLVLTAPLFILSIFVVLCYTKNQQLLQTFYLLVAMLPHTNFQLVAMLVVILLVLTAIDLYEKVKDIPCDDVLVITEIEIKSVCYVAAFVIFIFIPLTIAYVTVHSCILHDVYASFLFSMMVLYHFNIFWNLFLEYAYDYPFNLSLSH